MSRAAALKAAATRRAKLPPIIRIEPGRLTDYARATDAALLALIPAEQLELERFTDQYARGQWVRIQDNGMPVSGCSRTGGRGKRFAQLTERRLHRIEVELSRRGFSDDQIAEARHGDITFHFSEAV